MRKCSAVFVVVIVLFRPATASYSTFQSRVSLRDIHTEHVEFKSADLNRHSMTRARLFPREKLTRSLACPGTWAVFSKRVANCSHYVRHDNKVSCANVATETDRMLGPFIRDENSCTTRAWGKLPPKTRIRNRKSKLREENANYVSLSLRIILPVFSLAMWTCFFLIWNNHSRELRGC